MGLLEELIILIKDTVEEVSERQQQKQREAREGSAPTPRVSVEELRARMLQERRAAAEAARLAAQEAETPAPPPEPPRRREHGHARAEPKAKHAAQPASPERLARLLRQPHTVRELFVLKEILDKPLILRRGRR